MKIAHQTRLTLFRLFRGRRRKIFAGLLLLLLLFLLLVPPRMGRWLVVEAELQPAGAMVILMGSIADRALEAKDVYEQGYATSIVMVKPRQRGAVHLEPYGVELPSNSELTAYALGELGVPQDSIRILPGGAVSTREEAQIIRNFLEENPQIDSFILVSSRAHLRRGNMIFRKELRKLDHPVQIIPRPSSYSEFREDKWYRHRESAKSVFLEYLKIIAWMVGL